MASVLILLSLPIQAADNSIYIDQAGGQAVVTMTQDGAGNIIRGIQSVGSGNTTPAKINGDNNQVTVSQIGSGNTLSLGIITITGGQTPIPGLFTNGVQVAAINPTVIYNVTGNNATAIINSNNAGDAVSQGVYIEVNQDGNAANLNLNVLGANNALKMLTADGANNSIIGTVSGDNNSIGLSMTGGSGNQANLQQTGNGNMISLTSGGATNTFGVTQTDNNHKTTLDVDGSGNTYTVTQSGLNGANVLNAKTTGSGNVVTVTQTNRP